MNKTILYSGILSILSTATCALPVTQPTGMPGKPPVAIATNTTTAPIVTNPVVTAPAGTNVIQSDSKAVVTTPDTKAIVIAPGSDKPVAVVTTNPVVKPMDCSYKIPPQTTHIEQSIVMQWAEKATQQSFDFENNTIDQQLTALKDCYTDSGWQSFNDAFQKSGNLNAIKSQKLAVSSMVNGKSTASEVKENQWKVSIPLQVVYQNDKEKLTQLLTVDLIVGRKIKSGDLGIMQMIASPLKAENPATKTSNTTVTKPVLP